MDESDYKGAEQYARAKRAQVTLNEMWAERFAGTGVVFHSLHPGWVDTPGLEEALPRFRKVVGPLLRSPAQGADTLVWLAADGGVRLTLDARGVPGSTRWIVRRVITADRLPPVAAPMMGRLTGLPWVRDFLGGINAAVVGAIVAHRLVRSRPVEGRHAQGAEGHRHALGRRLVVRAAAAAAGALR